MLWLSSRNFSSQNIEFQNLGTDRFCAVQIVVGITIIMKTMERLRKFYHDNNLHSCHFQEFHKNHEPRIYDTTDYYNYTLEHTSWTVGGWLWVGVGTCFQPCKNFLTPVKERWSWQLSPIQRHAAIFKLDNIWLLHILYCKDIVYMHAKRAKYFSSLSTSPSSPHPTPSPRLSHPLYSIFFYYLSYPMLHYSFVYTSSFYEHKHVIPYTQKHKRIRRQSCWGHGKLKDNGVNENNHSVPLKLGSPAPTLSLTTQYKTDYIAGIHVLTLTITCMSIIIIFTVLLICIRLSLLTDGNMYEGIK